MSSECTACNLTVFVTQKRIKCTKCQLMFHLECVTTDPNPLRPTWVCPDCIAAARKGGDNSNTPVRQAKQQQERIDVDHSIPEANYGSGISGNCGDNVILAEIRNLRIDMIKQFQLQEQKLNSFNSVLSDLKGDVSELSLKMSSIRSEFDGLISTVGTLQSDTQRNEASLIKHTEKINELESYIGELKTSLNFISAQYDDMSVDFKKHLNTMTEMRSSSDDKQLAYLQSKVNMLENISRSHNLEIQSVPERKNENILGIVRSLFDKLSLQFSEDSVSFCSRVPKMNNKSDRPRNIIVTLQSPRHRDLVLSAAHRYNKLHSKDMLNSLDLGVSGEKTLIYIAEHLTPECKAIYAAARKFKKEKQYKYVWVKYGKVFLRKNDTSSAIYVKQVDVLNKLQ